MGRGKGQDTQLQAAYRGPSWGPSCPGCGLDNYQGLCPHCRGDQDAYEEELVPPFESSLSPEPEEESWEIPESSDLHPF